MTEQGREPPPDRRSSPALRQTDASSLLLDSPRRRMAAHFARKALALPMFVVTHAARRDAKLWVFGSFRGFRDSPRYVAEYIAQSEPDLAPWWLARSEGEAREAREAGLDVAMWGSRQAGALQRRAGVGFLCNGFRDLDMPSLGGAYIVHLYHGTPLKRVGLDVKWESFGGRSRAVDVLIRLNRWPMAMQLRVVDLFVAAGDLARARYMTAFGASAERVAALGSPRFDVIRGGPAYERVAGGDLRARLGLAPDDRLVLWLPTWRERGDAGWLPLLEGAAVDDALGDSRSHLLVKTHPFADWGVYAERLPDHPRVTLLREEEVDVNCLLHVADTLVTDYSSAAFDYAILDRPIHFFAPDVDEYSAGRDLYEPYEKVTGGRHHRDWRSLFAALAGGGAEDGPTEGEGMEVARRVAAYAGNNTAPDVSRRLTEAIRETVG